MNKFRIYGSYIRATSMTGDNRSMRAFRIIVITRLYFII